MRVAFLGLGAIGAPMAQHLARAFDLTVWNRTRARAEDFAKRCRARVAASPRDAATGANALITCLPTSAEVESLLDGPDGILAGLAEGAAFFDCTSGDPATSRRIAARLGERGIAFADAPVSGGTNGAEAGTITVMVGGSAQSLELARTVLGPFAGRIEHMGEVGAGHAMKAANNAILAANILSLGEALASLVAAGVDAGRAVAVLNASSGRSFVSEVLVPERVLPGSWPQTFRLALLEKDVRIALGVAETGGVDAPLLELTADLLGTARAALGGDPDYLEAIRMIESAAGVEIRA